LLDVGTGSGDIALAAVAAARRHGITLTAIGLEVIPAAAQLTRANGVEVVLGDGGALPFGAKSIDIVIASQVLHHLPRAVAVRWIASFDRVARLGVVLWAPLARAFPVAAQGERWPEILPHYRWVRFLDRSDRGGTVEMAAWRPFGLLRYPVWWVSEMTVDRTACEVRYRHVRGITAGMSVVWRLVPHAPGGTAQPEGVLVTVVHEWQGPGWPLS